MNKLSILTTIAVLLGFLAIPAWAGDPPTAPRAGEQAWATSAS